VVLKARQHVGILAVLVTLVSAATPSWPSSLSDGASAFRRGDYVIALRKLRPLAERGDAEAQALLAFMYQQGSGVPQDAVMAAHWYLSAAEQGHVAAQYQLGLLYDKGHGVPPSTVIAYKWLNLAAARAAPREREYYVRIRDAVAFKLNPEQLAQAQWLAASWTPRRAR
jgi:TPR repeat protein